MMTTKTAYRWSDHRKRLQKGWLVKIKRVRYGRPAKLQKKKRKENAFLDLRGHDTFWYKTRDINERPSICKPTAGVGCYKDKGWCIRVRRAPKYAVENFKLQDMTRVAYNGTQHMTFYRDHPNGDTEWLKIFFKGELGCRAVYNAIHALIQHGELNNLQLVPWLVPLR